MPLTIILLVLLAALLHALWNASVKGSRDNAIALLGVLLGIALLAAPLLPLFGFPSIAALPYLIASATVRFGYYICLANAYRHGDFAQAYPVARGSSALLIALIGILFLRELITPLQLLALIGILLGLSIYASRRLQNLLGQRAALTYAFACGAFITACTLIDALGARLSGNVAGYVLCLVLIDWLPLTLYLLIRQGATQLRRNLTPNWRLHLLGGAFSLAAYWILLWTMTRAPIALVSALRETSIIIAALIGAYYFKEPAGKRRVVASIVIALSIALLALTKA